MRWNEIKIRRDKRHNVEEDIEKWQKKGDMKMSLSHLQPMSNSWCKNA